MRRFLERRRHESSESGSGMAGIEALARADFDLVICDFLMTDEGSVETLHWIRELEVRIPIIAVSGASKEGSFSPLHQAMAMGASMALKKPFRMHEFLEVVDRVLGRSLTLGLAPS